MTDTHPPHSPLLVSTAVLPMYGEPDEAAEQVSQALLGMQVLLLERRGEWSRIQTPDRYHGWVKDELLTPEPTGWSGPWAEVTDLWINLRLRNHYQLAAAAHAPIGTRLPLEGEAKGWIQLLLPDGRKLWTEAKRVARLGETPLRPQEPPSIIETALRFRGVPYLWGGGSALGLDCSGFVQLVLRLHGVHLERDAGQQAQQGSPSPQPAAADLAFFSPHGPEGAITHVGMMLDRDRFVHALGSDYVRINRLSEPDWTRKLHSIRRYL